MMKTIECLGELIKMYVQPSPPKSTRVKSKFIGYAFASILLLAAIGFGYFALYQYLETIWAKPYISLMLSAGSLGGAIILLGILLCLKPKQTHSLPLNAIIKTLVTFSPHVLKGLTINKKGLVSLLALGGLYILLRDKHDK